MSSQKTQFITRSIALVENLALTHEAATGLAGVYTARGYNTGVTAITDDDLKAAGVDMTAVQFNAVVVPLIADFLSFGNNAALPAKDRKAEMNKARRDI